MTRLNVLTIAPDINPHDTLTLDEMDGLTDSLKGNPHAKGLTLLLWDSGMLPHEVAGLRITHLDTYNKVAFVGEGETYRTAWFGDYTAETLEKWLKQRRVSHDYLFFNPMDYQPFTRAEIIKYVGILLMMRRGGWQAIPYNCEGQNFHSFRSSLVHRLLPRTPAKVMLVALGINIPTLSKNPNYSKLAGEAAVSIEAVAYTPQRRPFEVRD